MNPTLTIDQPWPGAASYGLPDARFFYGRRRETDDLKRLVQQSGVTILLGAKGVGKTSLIHAGLLPSLQDSEWLPVVPMLDWTAASPVSEPAEIDPERPMLLPVPLRRQLLSALDAAATQRGLTSPEAKPNETLWEFFHRTGNRWWSARQRVVTPVIIIDDFDALFTVARQNATARRQAETFVQELAQLVANRPPHRLVTQLEIGNAAGEDFDFEDVPIKLVLVVDREFSDELEALGFPQRGELRLESFTSSQARSVLLSGALGAQLFTEAAIEAAVAKLAKDAGPDGRISPASLSKLAHSLAAERQKRGAAAINPELLSTPAPSAPPPAPATAHAPAEDLRAQLTTAEQRKRRSDRLATIAFIVAIAAFAIPQMIDRTSHRETGSPPVGAAPASPVQQSDAFATEPTEFLPPATGNTPTPAPTATPDESKVATPTPAPLPDEPQR